MYLNVLSFVSFIFLRIYKYYAYYAENSPLVKNYRIVGKGWYHCFINFHSNFGNFFPSDLKLLS